MREKPHSGSTRWLAACLVALAALLLHAPAWAAEGDYQPYQPGSEQAAVSAPLFVVIAYSAIWLVVTGFLVMVWRKQREVERELERLSRELAASAGRSER
jgi:CcmD family protein